MENETCRPAGLQGRRDPYVASFLGLDDDGSSEDAMRCGAVAWGRVASRSVESATDRRESGVSQCLLPAGDSLRISPPPHPSTPRLLPFAFLAAAATLHLLLPRSICCFDDQTWPGNPSVSAACGVGDSDGLVKLMNKQIVIAVAWAIRSVRIMHAFLARCAGRPADLLLVGEFFYIFFKSFYKIIQSFDFFLQDLTTNCRAPPATVV
jgi:hypothetical protein